MLQVVKGMTTVTLRGLMACAWIAASLGSAESICDTSAQKSLVEAVYWKQQKVELEALQELGSEPFQDGSFYLKDEGGRAKHLWDFFAPFYPCPVQERVGSVPHNGDTGRWVCGARTLLQHADCHVYSFGFSGLPGPYEAELLELAPECQLHIFDPSISPAAKARITQNPRILVHEYGLGPEDGPLELPEAVGNTFTGLFPAKKLETIMGELGHAWIDIIKLDIETLEWQALEQILFGSAKVLPFTQLLVEFHATHGINMLRVMAGLSQMGFRAFHQEHNIQGSNLGYQMVDYGYIQVDANGDIVGDGASYENAFAELYGCSAQTAPPAVPPPQNPQDSPLVRAARENNPGMAVEELRMEVPQQGVQVTPPQGEAARRRRASQRRRASRRAAL